MESFTRRKLRKLVKWFQLFFLLLICFFLLALIGRGREAGKVEEPYPSTPFIDKIRNNHLFEYDPSAPTNYSGTHKGWKQVMSRTVAERLNFKRDGFFVECGALDGVYLSNSLLLERMYGWTGLLVEADPASASVLKARNRNAWVADVCLSAKPYPMEVEMTGHRNMFELSYIKNDVIRKIRPVADPVGFGRKFQVQCFPLAMLMDALNRTEIDYFSLDVEGMELDILKTIPFGRIHIKLIGVEVRPGQKEEIQRFLQPLGYKKIKEVHLTTEFIHDDLYEFRQ